MLIELKNGETFNGKLANIDIWMNVSMRGVVRTSRNGDEFWSLPEVYVRGNTIKYVRVPDTVLDAVAEEKQAREAAVRLLPCCCDMFTYMFRHCCLTFVWTLFFVYSDIVCAVDDLEAGVVAAVVAEETGIETGTVMAAAVVAERVVGQEDVATAEEYTAVKSATFRIKNLESGANKTLLDMQQMHNIQSMRNALTHT